jgi:phosphoglycolate phosphatase
MASVYRRRMTAGDLRTTTRVGRQASPPTMTPLGVPFVFFDLDGTLTDSATSILASLAYAFHVNELPALDPHAARRLLGPPFYESLPPIVGDDMLWPVINAYRSHYRTTMLESPLYPGIAEILAALVDDGRRLAVASSKPEAQVIAILENHGLTSYFETIGGDEPDGSLGTKALVIERVLHRLGHPAPADILMVGDREHDVLGAREHAIKCLGAGWGYGLPGDPGRPRTPARPRPGRA